MTRWFEDILVDEVHPLGHYEFTEANIIAFASKYDPQYFHTDPELAVHSHFGGLIACGWQTASVGHRQMVDELAAEAERITAKGESPGVAGPGAGINFMEFHVPVRPGDVLHYSMKVISSRASKSLPGWGVLITHIMAHNQRGELVYVGEQVAMTKMRDFRPTLKQRLMLLMAKFPALRRLLGK